MNGTTQQRGGRVVGMGAIATLVLISMACVALGRWQMARAEGARLAAESLAAGARLAELNLRDVQVTEALAFRRAFAEGVYDSMQQFYLDGRREGERMGYHVITALRLTGTRRYVLVNRGWMPESERAAPVPAGKVRVSGILARPQLPSLRLAGAQGTTRTYLDPRAYAAESGRVIEPLILLALGESTSLVPVMPARGMREAVHRGYALQWFAFAAMAAGIAAVVTWKRVARHAA